MKAQWLTLKLCLVTVGVAEWIEGSGLSQLFQTTDRRKLTPGSVLGPRPRRKGQTKQDNDDGDDDVVTLKKTRNV